MNITEVICQVLRIPQLEAKVDPLSSEQVTLW